MTANTSKLPRRLTLLLMCFALPLSSWAQDSNQWDWSPIESVPQEQQDEQCRNCEGRYTDPLADADLSIVQEEQDITASAASSEMQGNVIKLSGGVIVEQGYRTLKGDKVTLHQDSESGTVEGNIEIREPGVLLRGQSADFSANTGEATVIGSQFVLHQQHIRGQAAKLHRAGDGLITIEDGSMSYCSPENNDWSIRANSIELNLEDGVGIARGVKLDIKDVPVLYLPWLSFPLDDRRKSGFLWPDIGSDSKGGVDIAAPLYLNLAPNYDALYVPRYIEERGINHELELRYLNPYVGHWSVGGAFMDDDKLYEDEFPLDRNHDRWLAVVKHNGLFSERWRSRVDYSKASDVNYLKDMDTSNLDATRQTALLQRGSVDYLGDNWLLEMEVQQFQSLADDINNDYKKLPQITGQYRGLGMPFTINPILLGQYSNFDSDQNLVTGERVYAEVGADYLMQWQAGFLKPSVKYRALDYNLEQGRLALATDKPSAGSALASLDGGLFFERPMTFSGTGLMQTLEPRLFYLYSEYDDQTDSPDFDSAELTFTYNQLFRETRFSGHDRLDDANQMSVGVTTRFIGDEDGHEYLSASIGQIFYFDDRRVRLKSIDPVQDQSGSEMAAELIFSPGDQLDVRTNIVWDPYTGDVNSGSVQTHYTANNGAIINVGYTYRRQLALNALFPPTEQTTISGYLPLGSKWSAFASWSYSLEGETTIEDMFGLEYDTCCWKVRVLHMRYLDNRAGQIPDFTDPNLEREESTQVQFILKGMGGYGSRVEKILNTMIRGFEKSEY